MGPVVRQLFRYQDGRLYGFGPQRVRFIDHLALRAWPSVPRTVSFCAVSRGASAVVTRGPRDTIYQVWMFSPGERGSVRRWNPWRRLRHTLGSRTRAPAGHSRAGGGGWGPR